MAAIIRPQPSAPARHCWSSEKLRRYAMDPFERDRIDRINREAELEKTPDDPEQPTEPGDTKPLIVMICRRARRDRDRARHHVDQQHALRRHEPAAGRRAAAAASVEQHSRRARLRTRQSPLRAVMDSVSGGRFRRNAESLGDGDFDDLAAGRRDATTWRAASHGVPAASVRSPSGSAPRCWRRRSACRTSGRPRLARLSRRTACKCVNFLMLSDSSTFPVASSLRRMTRTSTLVGSTRAVQMRMAPPRRPTRHLADQRAPVDARRACSPS